MATSLSLSRASQLGIIQYNGFQFPPAVHSSIAFVPVYSDDGRAIRYIQAVMTVEFILVNGMLTTTSPTHNPAGNHDINHVPLTSARVGGKFDPGFNTTDLIFPFLRQRLSEPCQPLFFIAKGIGDFRIQNSPVDGNQFASTYYDVDYGPKPRIVQWLPLTRNACKVIWECTTAFANCNEQQGLAGILQFPFNMSWDIGENGLTTRTISGSVEVPLTRDPRTNEFSASTLIRGTADDVREQIIKFFPRPYRRRTGSTSKEALPFQRRQNFSLSEDRKRLNFTISDTEIASDNPYFTGISRIDAQHSINSDLESSGFITWNGTLAGSIEIAPGWDKYRAWRIMVLLIDKIGSNIVKNGRGPKLVPGQESTENSYEYPIGSAGNKESENPSRFFLTSISVTEDLFGRTINFSLGYLLIKASLRTILKATGLLSPLGITYDLPEDKKRFGLKGKNASAPSWDLWQGSLSVVQGPRGYRQGRFLPENDVIVDLCHPTDTPGGESFKYDPPKKPRVDSDTSQGLPPAEEEGGDGDFEKPPAPTESDLIESQPNGADYDASYIAYDVRFDLITDEGTISHVPLSEINPIQEAVSTDVATLRNSVAYNDPGENYPVNDINDDPVPLSLVHKVRPSSFRVIFHGTAIRIGYQIPVPNLVRYGGMEAYKVGRDIVKERLVGVGTDAKDGRRLSVWSLHWRKEYVLKNVPRAVPIENYPSVYESKKLLVQTDAHKAMYT